MLKLNKKMNRLAATASASILTGLMASTESYAAQKSFNDVATKLTSQISQLPGLLTAVAYIFGVLLAILGLVKIKDHVENPSQTPLKEGAIRLAIGGALFTIPMITEAMQSLLDSGQTGVAARKMQKISTFNSVI
ncbi:MAG: hypothetical protein AAB276_04310 [Pseudomonadota bacterium]